MEESRIVEHAVYLKYSERLRQEIHEIFVKYIIPDNVIHIFHKYSRHIFTTKDVEFITALANNKGNTAGAEELLNRLSKYDGWFECLIKVLNNDEVKLNHIAVVLENIQEKLCMNISQVSTCENESPTPVEEKTQSEKLKHEVDILRAELVTTKEELEKRIKQHETQVKCYEHEINQLKNKRDVKDTVYSDALQTFEYPEKEINLLLIGRSGVGKSATGNSILGRQVFETDASIALKPFPGTVQSAEVTYNNRIIRVVDGIEWGEDEKSLNLFFESVKHAFMSNTRGFHALLIVEKFCNSFSLQSYENILKFLKEIFFEEFITRFCILVITNGKGLETLLKTQNITFKEWCTRKRYSTFVTIDDCVIADNLNSTYLSNPIVLFDNNTTNHETQREQIDELVDYVNRIQYCGHRFSFSNLAQVEKKIKQKQVYSHKKDICSENLSHLIEILTRTEELFSITFLNINTKIDLASELHNETKEIHRSIMDKDCGSGVLKKRIQMNSDLCELLLNMKKTLKDFATETEKFKERTKKCTEKREALLLTLQRITEKLQSFESHIAEELQSIKLKYEEEYKIIKLAFKKKEDDEIKQFKLEKDMLTSEYRKLQKENSVSLMYESEKCQKLRDAIDEKTHIFESKLYTLQAEAKKALDKQKQLCDEQLGIREVSLDDEKMSLHNQEKEINKELQIILSQLSKLSIQEVKWKESLNVLFFEIHSQDYRRLSSEILIKREPSNHHKLYEPEVKNEICCLQ
ncbi:uncharacterized protein LOC131944809 [Physella acuta]|uniref:uncharacterized protein LOC131944809 n=1 Tax=Physella acuta TaxID=109671 RepID=UPI0027DCEF92|nr:uncharacterized protein LOC131944809 [Physella acuta]XP_059161610.1 uncharacterized protein LOC131944809 [Physella acuta]